MGTIATLLLAACFDSMVSGQQLVLMKKGEVRARFNPGDEIYFGLKDQDQIHHSYLRAIHELHFVTGAGDTVAYTRIGRIKFRYPDRKKTAGYLALAGVAFYGIYLLNREAFSDTNETALNGLRLVAFYSMGAASVIYLTSNRVVKLNGIKYLMYVGTDSPLFR